mgnify:CR=1 FL=1
MKLIYNNFDGLDISFQGAFPMPLLNQLAEAKDQALLENNSVYREIGANKTPIMVAETGSKGGYRYRFDTGKEGETWFVKHSNYLDKWNIRVSVSSLSLALYGYEGVKERLKSRLKEWGAKGEPRIDQATNKRLNAPLERISRLDYCFDFITDSAFEPIPSRFVAHKNVKKHVYGNGGSIEKYHSLNGEKVNTVRLGEMPGRQVVLYNKTKEIIASGKKYWWDLWGVDPKPFKGGFKAIWRVEVRAGKDELNKWDLRRFKDFEEKAGDIIAALLKAMRYTNPLKDDLNRSRWPDHPIWQISLKTAFKALEPYSSNAIREDVLRGLKADAIEGYKERTIGNLIGLNTLKGHDISEIADTLFSIENSIRELSISEPDQLYRKVQKLEERARFLE